MTMKPQISELAVIGDETLVNGFKLAGIGRCRVISAADEKALGEAVRHELTAMIEDNAISIIVILEEYAGYASDLISAIRESKKTVPVIIEVPAIGEFDITLVKEYYKALARKFIGRELYI